MLSVFIFMTPLFWVIPMVLEIIGYYLILKKMELKPAMAIIPLLAEQQLSKKLFKRRRSFYRPVVLCAILVLAILYMGTEQTMSYLLTGFVFLIYGIFLMRLYWRLAKAFGKSKGFALLLILCPAVFLLVIGKGSAQYTQPEFKPDKERSRPVKVIRHIAFALISALEVLIIISIVGLICIRTVTPEILVEYIIDSNYESTREVTGTGPIVTREDMLGDGSEAFANAQASREYFFPDHENDKSVVVMTYIIGADLEGGSGLASANIRQMKEATSKGDGLKFIVQAGGSKRWFTPGFEDRKYGRYEISGGNITKIEDLPDDTCMSKGESLEDFISWARKNYPADRNMLVLWDHGGGLTYGYGQDDVNRYSVGLGTMATSDLVKAIDKADMKFDMIGFDACLMQDIEIAKSLEPYADFYLASEEVEGGFGWFYTSAFGMLAENPGMSSIDFGREIVGCYDPYNKIINDGKDDTTATLSFVDLTLAAPAYDNLTEFFGEMSDEINAGSGAYANIAVAANDTYAFNGNYQIDLIDFLEKLDKTDYNDSIYSHTDKENLIKSIEACILMRNGTSAKGINGMAFAFPYKSIENYTSTSDQFKALKLSEEKKAFDEIFSIIAVQKKRAADGSDPSKPSGHSSFAEMLLDWLPEADYTQESWYIAGFENYDNAATFIDIPLKETAEGYEIQLPEKSWKNIVDCQTMVYQQVDPSDTTAPEGARTRFIGTDHIADNDAAGHPMVDIDGYWPYIDGQIMCYEAEPIRETDEGYVFNGKVKARLNDSVDIILSISWDPVTEDSTAYPVGHVDGYMLADDYNIPDTKGLTALQAGDSIQFIFDYYDDKGSLIQSVPEGKVIRVSRQNRLKIEYLPMEAGTIEFCGTLTDIYQREMTTEMVEVTIGE